MDRVNVCDDEKGCFASQAAAKVNSGQKPASCCHSLSQPGMGHGRGWVGSEEVHPDS